MQKSVLFIADTLDSAQTYQQVLLKMDVEVSASSSKQMKSMLSKHPAFDLVVLEVSMHTLSSLPDVEVLLASEGIGALLCIVEVDMLDSFRLPVQINSDFIVKGADPRECATRIRMLLWPGIEGSSSDFVAIDNMTINLATYQVHVSDKPLDLTYLEYALLAFLVTHPGRTYSRDTLLRRVWGFDYYGGSRTVDVHVRRVRAKLGPELAQRLETVRGVGYLWNS